MKTIRFQATYVETQEFCLRVPDEVTEADVFFRIGEFTAVGRGGEDIPGVEYVDDDIVHETELELVRGSYREVVE
jgi:hypothetical protein